MPPVPTVAMISSKFTTSSVTIKNATAMVDACVATGWIFVPSSWVSGPNEQTDNEWEQH